MTSTTVTTITLPHFQCYEVDGEKGLLRKGVQLVDRFGTTTVTVDKPKRLCNPADKRGEDPDAPNSPEHLVGYRIFQTTPRPGRIRGQVVMNQFGTLVVDVITPNLLEVPSSKSTTAPPPPLSNPAVDHFKCYKIRSSQGAPRFLRITGVSVRDQFATSTVDLLRPLRLCAPANKNGEGVNDPNAFLVCYQARANPRFQQTLPIFTDNQFGPLELGKVTHVDEFCVPSTMP